MGMELVRGGSVTTGATPSSFSSSRPDLLVLLPGDLPALLRRPGQPDLDAALLPGHRVPLPPAPAPLPPRRLLLLRLHPRAARHHRRQHGQAPHCQVRNIRHFIVHLKKEANWL